MHEIKRIKKMKSKLLSDLKTELTNQLGDRLKSVILFGSQAWGKPTETSDYDILVVLKNDYDWKTEGLISNICYSIDVTHEIFTDPHIVSEYEIQNTLKGSDPLIINALNKGIYL